MTPIRSRRVAARGVCMLALLAAACSDPAMPRADDEDDLDAPVACDSDDVAGTPYAPGVNCRTLMIDGYPRSYLVYVPPGHAFSAEAPAPVVFMFHGSSGTGDKFLRISRWREKADEVGLIAVFPTGLEYYVLDTGRWSTKWNEYNLATEVDVGRQLPGYPPAAPWPADDVAFVRAMLDDVEISAAIDTAAMYVSGFSNGATFSSRLAVELTDRIAAFAWVGGGFCHPVATDWTDAPPRPAVMVMGGSDPKVLAHIAAAGGPTLTQLPLDPDSLFAVAPMADCIVAQVEAWGLEPHTWDPRMLDGFTQITWSTPAGTDYGNTFQFGVAEGLEHNYPNESNNPRGFVAVDPFWEFFRAIRLDGPVPVR